MLGCGHDFVQHAVHPVAHPHGFGLGLDVDVGGFVGDGLRDDQVDHPDDGSFLHPLLQIFQVDFFLILDQSELATDIGSLQSFDLVLDGGSQVGGAKDLVEDPFHSPLGGDQSLDFEAGDQADVVHRNDIHRVGHGQCQAVGLLSNRKDLVALGQVLRHQAGQFYIQGDVVQVDKSDAQASAQSLDQFALGHEAEVDDHLLQGGAIPPGLFLSSL